MASAAVMAAAAARVAAWSATRILGLNAGGAVPRRNTPLLAIAYPVCDEEQITIGAPGSNDCRETGASRVVLSIPAGPGLGTWPAAIDMLRAALRGQSFGGVVTWAAPPPTVDDRADSGAYFELSLAVPDQYDALGRCWDGAPPKTPNVRFGWGAEGLLASHTGPKQMMTSCRCRSLNDR